MARFSAGEHTALTRGRPSLRPPVPGLPVAVGDDGIAVLTIDRPTRHNAVTLAMWRALPELLDRVAAQPLVRVLLVTGAGAVFSAGADIDELRELYADPARAEAYHAVNVAAEQALAAFPHPTVAVVRGACVGGGCQLAVACDLRLAADGATLGITGAKLGVVYPAVPTARLTRLVGPSRAKYLLYTADLVGARRAAEFGLVDEVVPDGDLPARALELAATIASRSPQSLGAAKAVVDAAVDGDPDAAVAPWLAAAREAPDVPEGLRAFAERRPPSFPHRPAGRPGPATPPGRPVSDAPTT